MGRTDTWDQRTKGECREHGTALVHCCWECFTAYGERVASERAHSARLAERVAELEQMYAEMKDAADKGSKSVFALAAVQADNARMREALVDWADANDALRRAHLMLGMEDKQAQLKFRAAADKLMVIARSSPSSDAALREVCEKVADNPWFRFGCSVWKNIAGDFDSESAWELWEVAETCGLAERVKFDPAIHSSEDAEPGDEIMWPIKGDPKSAVEVVSSILGPEVKP